ncbi:MAG TPA: Maf family protein, partial [Xanthobacteraceae bacterium]
ADLQSAGTVAFHLAREKAMATAKLRPGRLTLGADQTLALGAQRFAKPADRDAARAQLRALRGHSHELHSAIVFVQDGKVLYEHVGVARMTMRPFSDRFLEAYLDTLGHDMTTTVGVYQIEGLGVQLFDRIEGDYFTVLGLPLTQALDFLRRRGCLAQ